MLVDGEASLGVVDEAIARAAHAIFLIGWNFNSRVRLRRGAAGGPADSIGARLERAVARRRGLRVRILDWDFSLLYAWQRETRCSSCGG